VTGRHLLGFSNQEVADNLSEMVETKSGAARGEAGRSGDGKWREIFREA
jgi:hypothetical protein